MELQEQLELFEHTESDKILEAIHTEVREQLYRCIDTRPLRKSMDDDDMRQTEPWMYFWVVNLLK